MKAFIFDQLWDDLVTDDLLAKIKDGGLWYIGSSDLYAPDLKKEIES